MQQLVWVQSSTVGRNVGGVGRRWARRSRYGFALVVSEKWAELGLSGSTSNSRPEVLVEL